VAATDVSPCGDAAAFREQAAAAAAAAIGVRQAGASCFSPGSEGEPGVLQRQLGAHEGSGRIKL
jgi:hypothetical protein